ncbi:MAG: YicC family protein [Deltaproteobacteria bacterium]|nr:YicC family protein [Deltaproteobacteria bacterium]
MTDQASRTSFLASMTGYGEAERRIDRFLIRFVLQSVNSRFLDVRFRLPHSFAGLEARLREKITANLERGKVDVFFYHEAVVDSSDAFAVSVDYSLLNVDYISRFYREARAVIADLGCERQTDILLPALFSSVFSRREAYDTSEAALPVTYEEVLLLFDEALQALAAARLAEGKNLAASFARGLSNLSDLIVSIENLAGGLTAVLLERLHNRLTSILSGQGVELDPSRVHQEVALLAEKADIAEELLRFKSHVQQFDAEIVEPVLRKGKKLEFLLQEMLREVNTIGSKANCLEITKLVLEAKNEVEKMREQVQNVI